MIIHKPLDNILLYVFLCLPLFTFQCSEDNDPAVKGSMKECSTCTFVIAANNTNSIIDGATLGVKPGDTICLNAALKYRSSLTFKNIVGTAAEPVIITNCNGTVNIVVSNRPYNIKISNSKYFRITGGDTEGVYGFNLTGSISDGIVLADLTSDFEVDHVEIHHVGFAGLMAKTDPTCDDATIRGNYTMRNVLLHDNFIHDTEGEGFYLGSSSYGGVELDGCGTRLPHTIENISVYNNHVLRSGWDGIQLSCATVGAAIYGNVVENYGVKNEPAQQNGILMGGGTGGVCYGNLVNGGTGVGICTFGLGNNIFHDNIVINAGDKGFFCDERGTLTEDGFKFINNTVINPKDIGIAIYSETLPHNVCINNIIVKANGSDDKSYITTLHNAPTVKSNNYTTTKIEDLIFVEVKGINYKVLTGSPVIDQGADISSYDIGVDFYNDKRKNGSAYDIGASEF